MAIDAARLQSIAEAKKAAESQQPIGKRKATPQEVKDAAGDD